MSQTIRFRLLAVGFLGLSWMASCTGQPEPPASPALPNTLAEHPGVHVLLALDTNDPKIGKAVTKDKHSISSLVASGLPLGKLSVTVIEGDELSKSSILDYYKKLEFQPEDTVFFYFSGHGSTNDEAGHVLYMPRGSQLPRSELREVVVAKRGRLSVILTDCCAVLPEKPPVYGAFTPTSKLGPVVQKLLLAHRGEVDINACSKGEYAYCTPNVGGFFTASFTKVCVGAAERGDRPSWRELFPAVVKETRAVDNRQTPQKMTKAAWPVVE